MKTYKFYADPGHAWMAVKIKELMRLGVITKISGYSYMRGSTAYLEEDCDAAEFFHAYKEKYGKEPIVDFKHVDRISPIRSYDRFNVNKAIDIALIETRTKNAA